MADIRINALATTATSSASDDYIAIDGAANGTRKLSAYSPTFGGNLTVSGAGTSSVAGNWGIGTTSPSGILHTYASNGVNYFESPGISGVWLQFVTNSSNRYKIGQPSASADLAFLAAGTTETMRLTSSGNLLLGGTVDGGYKLYVKGNSDAQAQLDMASGGNYTTLYLANAGTNKAFLSWGNTGNRLYLGSSAAGSDFALYSAGSVALTLDSSQNATFAGTVKIANTSAITGVRTTTATTNFGNVAGNDSAYVDVTVTGAATNDSVIVNCKDIINGVSSAIVLSAFIVSANTVRVVARNVSASTVNSVTGTSRITVISF